MPVRKKVLCPIEGKNGKTYWIKLGSAFPNSDGSTNIYLDALPKNSRLQIRDLDEKDYRKDSLDEAGGQSEDDPFLSSLG